MFAKIKTSIAINLVKILYLVSYILPLNDIVAHVSHVAHRPLVFITIHRNTFLLFCLREHLIQNYTVPVIITSKKPLRLHVSRLTGMGMLTLGQNYGYFS